MLAPLVLPAFLAAGLLALSFTPKVFAIPALAGSFQLAAGVLVAGAVLVGLRARREQRRLGVRFVPVRAHWVQSLVHVSLYTAWALDWTGVVEHVPHFLAQLLFYYGFDLLLGWWRRDEARTGFGPIPIVGSVNLFLWFQDGFFVFQFAMLAVGALAKELVAWERDGRRAHVFNPSSFPLFLVCAFLLAFGGDANTFARDIAITQGQVPDAFVGIFLLGLVVQSLFATTLVTLSAVVTLYGVNLVYTAVTGVYCWVDVGIPAAIFLGCTFLVTDPATSPRTARGRALFGVLYGLAIFVLYVWLRETGGPAYYDKLLCVPVLNLMVRRLDRLGGPPATRANLAWVAAAGVGFAAAYASGFLGPKHPGNEIAFWEEACEAERWHGCQGWADLLDEACHEEDWGRCHEFAVLEDEGTRIDRDRADAGYHFALACQEGWQPACERIPGFLAEGGGAALQAACEESDDGLACLVAGTLWLRPIGGVEPDDELRERARAAIERGCELGVEEACAFVAR